MWGSATGTSEALYAAGDANGEATLRSFGVDGGLNWSVAFGAFDGEGATGDDSYPFGLIPPAVTDGSVALVSDGDEPTVRCLGLPESEWLGRPDRETTPTDTPTPVDAGAGTDTPGAGAGDTPSSGDSGDSSAGDESEVSAGDAPDGGSTDDRPERGFFTNGGDDPASVLTGTGLTALSTGITLVGVGATIVDMIRGGDD